MCPNGCWCKNMGLGHDAKALVVPGQPRSEIGVISSAPIDVWDLATFDDELRGSLVAYAGLIRDYFVTSRRQFLEREASDHTAAYPDNPHASEFYRFTENVMGLMEARTIRAWHYTRMTDAEVNTMRRVGVYPSTLDNIRARLAAQVDTRAFSQEVADRLFADSPYQAERPDSRLEKFWMVSHPLSVEDSGVESLLKYWGGESVYFRQCDPQLQTLLKNNGTPRVLEIAMPLSHSSRSYLAAEAVVSTYGRVLGCSPEKKAFDLYSNRVLGPEHILAVHSQADLSFANMAHGYPLGYIDVDSS